MNWLGYIDTFDTIKKELLTMTEAQKLESVLRSLANRAAELAVRTDELTAQRKCIAFDAHTGHEGSMKELTRINKELASVTVESQSIEAAIIAGKQKLDAARKAEASAANRRNAELIENNLLPALRDCGTKLDRLMQELREQAKLQIELVSRLHQLGCTAPTLASVMTNSRNACQAALTGTAWASGTPLRASEKQDFQQLFSAWEQQIQHYINSVLGSTQDEKAA